MFDKCPRNVLEIVKNDVITWLLPKMKLISLSQRTFSRRTNFSFPIHTSLIILSYFLHSINSLSYIFLPIFSWITFEREKDKILLLTLAENGHMDEINVVCWAETWLFKNVFKKKHRKWYKGLKDFNLFLPLTNNQISSLGAKVK